AAHFRQRNSRHCLSKCALVPEKSRAPAHSCAHDVVADCLYVTTLARSDAERRHRRKPAHFVYTGLSSRLHPSRNRFRCQFRAYTMNMAFSAIRTRGSSALALLLLMLVS